MEQFSAVGYKGWCRRIHSSRVHLCFADNPHWNCWKVDNQPINSKSSHLFAFLVYGAIIILVLLKSHYSYGTSKFAYLCVQMEVTWQRSNVSDLMFYTCPRVIRYIIYSRLYCYLVFFMLLVSLDYCKDGISTWSGILFW